MISRILKYGTNLLILVLTLAGILAVINYVSLNHFFRLDLTEKSEFTLAPSTKKVLKGLDDVVNIKVYFSRKLPPYLTGLQRQVRDVLDEYQALSRGKLKVEFIDPGIDPMAQQKLRFMGIPQVQLNIYEKDQAQLITVYLGMAILYEDKKEIIPVITDTNNLEYDLTGALIRMIRKESKTVGFLTGHGERAIEGDYSQVRSLLEKQYQVVKVETKDGRKIGDDINTLVVANPRKMGLRDLYEIDHFIMKGGKAIFLVDTVDLMEQRLQAFPMECSIVDLLKTYGVKVNPDLVLDLSNAPAMFRSGMFNVQLPYPFWVKIQKKNFAADQPMVNKLDSLVLPWASSLELIPDKTGSVKAVRLFRTTDVAFNQKEYFNLSPEQAPPDKNQCRSFVMGALLSGRFKSYFSDRAVPPIEGTSKNAPEQREEAIKESKETQIIVVGNSRFLQNQFFEITQSKGNEVFFLNIVDWLNIGEELIGIRTKGFVDRPLKVLSSRERTVIQFINILGMSIVMIAFGFFRLYLKRKKKAQVFTPATP
ncbi:MAG: GldG family protein [Proteobacteria bacterium]|nr:GldG family protein [Pseudomonadota bacterium]